MGSRKFEVRIIDGIEHKKCSECGEWKPENEYRIGFLGAKCKECRNKARRIGITTQEETKARKIKRDNMTRIKPPIQINGRYGYYCSNCGNFKPLSKFRGNTGYRCSGCDDKRILEYCNKNKEEVAGRKLKYINKRRATDPLFRLKMDIRTSIRDRFNKKNWKKNSHTFDIVQIKPEEFKIYIENQFTDGMSWENRSKWHLDHKVPIKLAKTEEELRKLNHYSNFQPLWAKDNLKKGAKLLPKHKKLMFELLGRN